MEIKPPKYTRDLSLMNGYPLPRVPKYVDSVRPTAEWCAKHRKVNKKAYERLAMERDAQVWGAHPDTDISDRTRMWLAHKECTVHKQWPPCLENHKVVGIDVVQRPQSKLADLFDMRDSIYKEPSDALYGELL